MVKKKQKKKQKKKKKLATTEIFHQKFPLSFNSFHAGEEVVYTRMSDNNRSIGKIWYFYVNCERPAVCMFDLLKRNFQTGFVDEIDINASVKENKSLQAKATLKVSRQ